MTTNTTDMQSKWARTMIGEMDMNDRVLAGIDCTDTERKLQTQINLLTTTNEVLAEKLAAAETALATDKAYVRELEDANTPEIKALAERIGALEADAGRYRWLSAYLVSPGTQHDDAIVDTRTKDELDSVIDAKIKEQK